MNERKIETVINIKVDPADVATAKNSLQDIANISSQSTARAGGAPTGGGAEAAYGMPPPLPPLPSQMAAGGMGGPAAGGSGGGGPMGGPPPLPPLPSGQHGGPSGSSRPPQDEGAQQRREQEREQRRQEQAAARAERERQREEDRIERDMKRAQREDELADAAAKRAAAKTRAQYLGYAQSAGGFISNAASTAIGVGLGNSIFGFLTSSAEQYAALSDVLTGLNAKFRDSEVAAASFGLRLGYTRAEAGALAEVLGGQTDTLDVGMAQGVMGMARFTGMDASQIGQVVGQSARLTGAAPNMGRLRGQALSMGMGRGRFGEYLNAYSQAEERMFSISGSANEAAVQAMVSMPGMFFGSRDERAKGAYGQRFGQSVQDLLTGGGDAMTLELLRSMGYGSKGGPGYIDAMIAIDEGVQGRDGMKLLYQLGSNLKGYGEDRIFTALQGMWKGSKRDLQTFARGITNDMTLEDIQRAATAPESTASMYEVINMSEMKTGERGRYVQGGFAEAGRQHVSMGQQFKVAREGLTMDTGPTMLGFTIDMIKATRELGEAADKMIKYMTGNDFKTLVEKMGERIVGLSESLNDLADTMSGRKLKQDIGLFMMDIGANANEGARNGMGFGPKF